MRSPLPVQPARWQLLGRLGKLSLRSKLQAIIMVTVAAALLLFAGIMVIRAYVGQRSYAKTQLEILAEMVGTSSTAALSLNDHQGAEELLQGLKAHPSIARGALFAPDGPLVGVYYKHGETEISRASAGKYRSAYQNGRLTVFQPVMMDGQTLGSIYLESDLRELHGTLATSIEFSLLILTVCALLAYWLAARLQHFIFDPIQHLAQTAKAVTVLKNYSIRAHKYTEDELGILIDEFNQMLDGIEGRERDLAHHRQCLEDVVCERTAELRKLNRQLIVERNRAEQANCEKSEFLAKISAQTRTPVSGILGMTERLMDSQLTSEQRASLLIAQHSAASLLRMLDKILDVSSLEAGKLQLESLSFKLRDVLSESLRPLELRAAEKGLDLEYVAAPDLPERVIGDSRRLCQILNQVVENAVQFTEHGRVIIKVRTSSAGPNSAVLEFAVHDTGPGIPREKLRTIFDGTFAQANPSQAGKLGGTGLGLTISSKLVRLMNGSITVDSTPEVGSCFRFHVRLGLPSAIAIVERQGYDGALVAIGNRLPNPKFGTPRAGNRYEGESA